MGTKWPRLQIWGVFCCGCPLQFGVYRRGLTLGNSHEGYLQQYWQDQRSCGPEYHVHMIGPMQNAMPILCMAQLSLRAIAAVVSLKNPPETRLPLG